MTPDAHQQPVLPLDERLYNLDNAEITFFKQQTGIDDSDELKAHLLSIQAEPYQVYSYFCIRHFTWARLRISRLFAYPDLLKLGREREGAILLEVGSCFGTDVRKAILDGFPLRNVAAQRILGSRA